MTYHARIGYGGDVARRRRLAQSVSWRLHVDDQKVVKIHSLYVQYLLPMMCEVQWWEFAA